MSDQSEEFNRRVSEFVSITGASTNVAQSFLENSNYELETALQNFFEESKPTATTTKKKIRTFQDIANGVNDDTSEDEDVNLFTGGEKSALQVENPNKNNPANLVQDILRKATDPNNGIRDDDPAVSKQKFTGTGFKLGDSQTPSTTIPDRSSVFKKPERVERKITFWKDGFSVGEGKLYRYDDPRNSSYLRDLNSGRAPLELLDVQLGQDVDVNVDKRLDEEYKLPKRKLGGFVGSGQRLGSPVPGEVEAAPAPAATTTKSKEPVQGEGDAKVQIRFADGRRRIHIFKSSDPVQVIYDYVTLESSSDLDFNLSLPYPVKPIDKNISIKDAGLINAAVIQRWCVE